MNTYIYSAGPVLTIGPSGSSAQAMATLKVVTTEADYGRGCMYSKVPDALASTVSQSHSGDNIFVSYNSTNDSLCQNYGTLAVTGTATDQLANGYLEYEHVQASARL